MHRVEIACSQIILASPMENMTLLIYNLLTISAKQITDISAELQLMSWFVFEDHVHEECPSLNTEITLHAEACSC